jgi:hypothetical protein
VHLAEQYVYSRSGLTRWRVGYVFVVAHDQVSPSTRRRSTLLRTGYFTFKECPGLWNPTIGIEVGQTYMFDQADRSNWFHPMGFAYFPDGAHDDKAELEPAVSLNSTSNCKTTFSCPTPLYYLDGKLLGVAGTNDFGLDAYEPDFFLPIPEWSKRGTYSVALSFDDEAYTKDIFYFCHVRIVSYMNGLQG